MKRGEIDIDEIKKLPITTNRIEVGVNKSTFFDKYSIVSYYSTQKEKNLAYEQLADVPCLSVTGIRARWAENLYPSVRFFILTKKGNENDVLKSLRDIETVKSSIDSLESYSDILQKRILASLAINSLGKTRKNCMMYNNGSLLLSDDENFLIRKSHHEQVCLKIEINEYMNLIAKTTSFSHPKSFGLLQKNALGAFQTGKFVDGYLWAGQSVKPVIVRNLREKGINLEDFYIQKKRFSDNHNIVSYWPYHTEKYMHGKLFAISQVVESVNEDFDGLLHLSFKDYEILHYDEYKSKDEMLAILKEQLAGRNICIQDPFNTESSREVVRQLQEAMQVVMEQSLTFAKKPTEDVLLIKLCEPIEESRPNTFYAKSIERMTYDNTAVQHIIFYNNEEADKVATPKAQRILLELIVKDCIAKRQIPQNLAQKANGWKFYRYKIKDGLVRGASLFFADNGGLNLTDHGFSPYSYSLDFETFAQTELSFTQPEKISGRRDYMALKKGGNVYLIVDTDEIPILDAKEIDEGYNEVVKDGVTLSKFKRKAVAHKYLRGYIGMHLWQTEGLDSKPNGAYSYIAGTNKESLQIKSSTKMERVPRARRIFVLHKENPDSVESQINEITDMLKLGLGRWNEIMTYPFPFKFLQEHLDNLSEMNMSKHWKEV